MTISRVRSGAAGERDSTNETPIDMALPIPTQTTTRLCQGRLASHGPLTMKCNTQPNSQPAQPRVVDRARAFNPSAAEWTLYS